MKSRSNVKSTCFVAGLLLLRLAGGAVAAEQPGLRTALYQEKDRQLAPGFGLQDSTGKSVRIEDYRGKVVLLDFWATWCTGCKKEIPWFSEFLTKFSGEGFAVVGVSMDQGGWKVLRPFLDEHPAPYPMLLGNEAVAQRYGIKSLPDTFLIDRQGRLAAAYKEGLVDRNNVEANIRALLSRSMASEVR